MRESFTFIRHVIFVIYWTFLLSIAGKAYAAILMRRLYQEVDSRLHEAQCGFRQGRGTVDAMFALRSIGAACSEHHVCLAKAYIDFTKAYDSINRAALWRALRLPCAS